jgi:hypothetical protein
MIASILRGPARLAREFGATALIVLAVPAWAADFEVENLRLDLGAFVVAAPKVAVKGSSLEREAFVSLFNANSGESAVARTGRLDAAEISAPELRLEQAFGPQRQTTVYRDIRLSDVKGGRIGRGSAESGTVTVVDPTNGPMKGEFKRFSFEAFDMRQLARVFTERAKPGVEEVLLPIFGRFDQDGYTLDMGQAGKFAVGKVSGRDFKAKVSDEPLSEILSHIVAQAEADQKAMRDPKAERDPAQTEADKRMALSMLSLFDSMDYGSGEVRDMVMTIKAPPKPGDAPVPFDARVSRVAYGEDTPAKSGYVMEGFEFAGGGAKGRIDSLSYSGFSFGPALKELKELLAKPDADFDTIDYRKLIPTLGTMRMTGLSVDAPRPGKPGQPALPPIRVGLGTFELKAQDQLNGVPTKLTLTIDKLTAPVTEGPSNPAAKDLIAMGYKAVDLSAKLDLAWDAARNELAIRTLSFGGADMAQFEASGTLGNVTKDLFSSDLALAQVAALGATARNLEAKLRNFGLIEKVIENEARKAKRKPEELRREYAMMASLGLAAILGPSDAAKALTAAVARFAAQPGTLSVQANAKSGGGLGLADVLTMGDPTEIFDKIDLKANAE